MVNRIRQLLVMLQLDVSSHTATDGVSAYTATDGVTGILDATGITG